MIEIEIGKLYAIPGTNIRFNNNSNYIDILCQEKHEDFTKHKLTNTEIYALIGFLQSSLKGDDNE